MERHREFEQPCLGSEALESFNLLFLQLAQSTVTRVPEEQFLQEQREHKSLHRGSKQYSKD